MIPVPSGVKVWLATGHTDSMLINQQAEADEIACYLFTVATERMGLADHGIAELCNRAATAVVALRSNF